MDSLVVNCVLVVVNELLYIVLWLLYSLWLTSIGQRVLRGETNLEWYCFRCWLFIGLYVNVCIFL